VATSEPPKLEHEVTFLFNFFDEQRRRAPGGREVAFLIGNEESASHHVAARHF
jgi:hypothetical protein